MAGPGPSKHGLEDAAVYVHVASEEGGATVTHVDVEHPDLNEIVEPGENTYVGGKDGGVFVGLKDRMIERAEAYVERRRDHA
jgi:hemerythrin-like domain-containing protein